MEEEVPSTSSSSSNLQIVEVNPEEGIKIKEEDMQIKTEIEITLESLIAVGVRLLIFGLFSSPYALIRHPTLIRFWHFDYCFT